MAAMVCSNVDRISRYQQYIKAMKGVTGLAPLSCAQGHPSAALEQSSVPQRKNLTFPTELVRT